MGNFPDFINIYLSFFFRPKKAFISLSINRNNYLYGLLALLIPAAGYTVFYILASKAGGAPTVFIPWLNIPMKEYFYYAIFLSIPGYLLAFFFSSGVLAFISRAVNVKISFESALYIIGFGVGVGSWASMVHDLTDAVLGFTGLINMAWYEQQLNQDTVWRIILMLCYSIYFAWFFALFYKGIKIASNCNTLKAIFLAVMAIICFQGVLLLFIR